MNDVGSERSRSKVRRVALVTEEEFFA